MPLVGAAHKEIAKGCKVTTKADIAKWLDSPEPDADEFPPELVLATWQDLPFKPDAGFEELELQTGGVACHHPKLWGKRLEMTEKGKELATVLARKYWYSNIMAPASLSRIVGYTKVLRHYKQTCETHYTLFEEALYPMDFGAHAADIAVIKDLPKDLNDFVDWPHKFSVVSGIYRRWFIAILTENSD